MQHFFRVANLAAFTQTRVNVLVKSVQNYARGITTLIDVFVYQERQKGQQGIVGNRLGTVEKRAIGNTILILF